MRGDARALTADFANLVELKSEIVNDLERFKFSLSRFFLNLRV